MTPKMTPFWDPYITGLGGKNGVKWPKMGQKRGPKSDPKRDPQNGPLPCRLPYLTDARARARVLCYHSKMSQNAKSVIFDMSEKVPFY